MRQGLKRRCTSYLVRTHNQLRSGIVLPGIVDLEGGGDAEYQTQFRTGTRTEHAAPWLEGVQLLYGLRANW